jgi:hypothetical protein
LLFTKRMVALLYAETSRANNVNFVFIVIRLQYKAKM